MKADRAKLLESSIQIKTRLEKEVRELRSQLQTEKARWADVEEELQARDKTCANLQGQLSDRDAIIAELRSELADLKQKSVAARDSTEKAPKILSLIKPWLSPKAPKNLLSKLEEVLEDD
ncbi:hypothetical protein QUB37_29175 [Microcoleus sp. AT3-A2]|uniref:hypothetical protein n=1 Tax=Microcoleus sp. AT3-A2 TaxID=2818610 RepID=UPI002FD36877